MSSTDQGGGKRRAGIVRWRPQKSLASEGILFKSAEGEPLRYQLVRQTYGAHVRRRGMKARPPFGGFAFFSASQISHKAELMPVVRKSSAYGFRGAWRPVSRLGIGMGDSRRDPAAPRLG